jgi:hypothetical protein
MATKVAQIKKLAKVDVSEEGKEDGDENGLEAPASLRYMSTRPYNPMSSISPPGGKDQPLDVYDKLDKDLKLVQSMCEHGAHQFLRDGDCNDEIGKARKQLKEILEKATREMERVRREEPELVKEAGELEKVPTRRLISIRREMCASLKDGASDEDSKLEAAKTKDSKLPSPDAQIEVDPRFIEADKRIDVEMDFSKYSIYHGPGGIVCLEENATFVP